VTRVVSWIVGPHRQQEKAMPSGKAMSKETFQTVVLKNLHGLHMRPAKGLMEEARRFNSDVFIGLNGNEVNGKSILGLATLGAACGQELEIRCVGDDADEACKHLSDYVAKFPENFDEERVE
jgi:phosphotransferase system HPr (HPr) family protein